VEIHPKSSLRHIFHYNAVHRRLLACCYELKFLSKRKEDLHQYYFVLDQLVINSIETTIKDKGI